MTYHSCVHHRLPSASTSMLDECHEDRAMSGRTGSEFGTMLSADRTVEDAVKWAEELQRMEFRGLGDTREAARSRLSIRIGIPESYLKRLRHKVAEITDVPASVYLRLLLAYEQACVSTERAAEHVRHVRQTIRNTNEASESHGGIVR